MYRLISIFWATLIILASSLVFPINTLAVPTSQVGALPLVKNIFSGNTPDNIGVNDGHLVSCPDSPNCVVSQDGDATHSIEPIAYDSDRDIAKETLLKVLSVVPRTQIIEQTDNYIYAQSESKLMGFIDDLEFYFPEDEPVIQLRSASRLGESDLGVNRRRMEQIRFAFDDLST